MLPKADQQQDNKALHPTAYSFGFGRKLPSPPLPAAGELGRSAVARSFCDASGFLIKLQVR